MKTRILQTKFWNDSFIAQLNSKEKLVFIYLLTNEAVNIIHCYEINDQRICVDTSITLKELDKIKQKFSEANKIKFKDGWVFLLNGHKYEKYVGEKNEVAKNKILEEMSTDIKQWFLDRGIYTPTKIGTINHKSEIINHKPKVDIDKVTKSVLSSFEQFWSLYPKKKDKAETIKKWGRLDKETRQKILEVLPNHIAQWQNPKYIPLPTTWLNKERWNDEIEMEDTRKFKIDFDTGEKIYLD